MKKNKRTKEEWIEFKRQQKLKDKPKVPMDWNGFFNNNSLMEYNRIRPNENKSKNISIKTFENKTGAYLLSKGCKKETNMYFKYLISNSLQYFFFVTNKLGKNRFKEDAQYKERRKNTKLTKQEVEYIFDMMTIRLNSSINIIYELKDSDTKTEYLKEYILVKFNKMLDELKERIVMNMYDTSVKQNKYPKEYIELVNRNYIRIGNSLKGYPSIYDDLHNVLLSQRRLLIDFYSVDSDGKTFNILIDSIQKEFILIKRLNKVLNILSEEDVNNKLDKKLKKNIINPLMYGNLGRVLDE